MTTGILVKPGYGGIQYFLTEDGHIIGLQVAPTPATASPSGRDFLKRSGSLAASSHQAREG